MKGYTKTGQPIQGRKFKLTQESVGIVDVEVEVVGKLYGRGGNSDLVGIILEECETGGRMTFPWPLEPLEGASPILLEGI